MNVKKNISGYEMEKMLNIAFRCMSFIFSIRDIFFPVDKKLEKFNIKEGFTIVDYGCGPGSYLKKASGLVGEKGKVFALDIHELAIKKIKKKSRKYNLKNVFPILVNGYTCELNDNTADIIYALDMFHMIKNPALFLKELNRLIKKDGFLIIEDGHQLRSKTKKKIESSGVWSIVEETKDYLKCTPV